jgi:hypothetical protein
MLFLVAGKPYASQKCCKHCRNRPGQEEGNVPFVEDAGFGKYSGDPQLIADTVSSWLASPKKMESMKSAALAAARPSATLDIARDLADIAFATKTSKEKVLVRAR